MAQLEMIGTVIGHYRIVERLGEGGMGEVYLAEDLKLHRRAALKLIKPELTRDPARRDRFIQEATLAASVDHPHVAAIHDIDEADGRTYIAMEYVEGRSLREWLKTGPLPLTRALDLAIQIADALAKVHEKGVVHRDLKPDNILVAGEGYAKIIDFGVAKLIDPIPLSADAETLGGAPVRTADGLVLGTMGYMSPEQVRGEAVDARSDIFSFGALLHEMVSGDAPFRRANAAETISAVLKEPPAPVRLDDAGVEPELQRILRKCLAKDAAARYQGMRDVAVDLRAIRATLSSGESAVARVGTAAATKRARRPGAPATVALLVALVAAAAVAAWMWSRREAGPASVDAGDGGRPAVAVMTFEVITGGDEVAWLDKGLPSMLVTGLAQTPDVEVVGPERLRDAARQLGAASLEALDRARTSELVRRAGARYVVTGNVMQAGGEIRIDARVEDLTSGAVRWAQSVRGADALTLADELAARIRIGLDIPATNVQRVADVTSRSVEAYRAYTAGVEAVTNVRSEEAWRLFNEAVRLDPTFALAHVGVAGMLLGRGQDKEARDALALAARHLDHLVERDQLLVQANLSTADGEWDEAERVLERLMTRYPDTERAYLTRASLSRFAGPRPDTAAAVAVIERGLQALPYSAALHNSHGYALLESGRTTEALAAFETYVKLRPTEPNALDSVGEGQLVAGDLDAALASCTRAFDGGHIPARHMRGWTLAVLGRFDEAFVDVSAIEQAVGPVTSRALLEPVILGKTGRYREAERRVDAIRRRIPADDTFPQAVLSLSAAWLALERGECGAAGAPLAAAERAVAGMTDFRRRPYQVLLELLAGTCSARQGRLADARARLARAEKTYAAGAPNERWWVLALQGEIALAAGDPEAADRAFAAGEPERKMVFNRGSQGALTVFANNLALRDGRARAAAAQGNTEEAIGLYRELLTTGPGQKWTAVFEPRYVLAIARLLDKVGRRAEARQEYLRFLEYWKQADPGLPELVEARGRVS